MADIRIKDLTTTASSSASDDFIAIDGTTNGTRKLNAFSPTFGGDATVAGALTVNGVSNSKYLSITSSGTGQNSALKTSDGTTTWYTGILGGTETTDGSWRVYDTTTRFKVEKTTGNVSIASTSASTTTSSGALVVSGGVGVGGNINAGGTTFRLNSKLFGVGDGTTTYLYSQGSGGFILRNAADSADIFRITNAGVTSIVDTTASTSTSSGALVVSGGVGVAGAVFTGGNITTSGGTVQATSASSYAIASFSANGAANVFFGSDKAGTLVTGTADGDAIVRTNAKAFRISVDNGSTSAFTVAATTGNITLSSSLTTGAPSGGTAAAWKLGSVATVSPTSPNRTIEVDIGGTIYYIHAKTTNN